MRKITLAITPELCAQLGITDGADDSAIGAAIVAVAKKAATVDTMQAKVDTAEADKLKAQNELKDFKATQTKGEIKTMLSAALDKKKIGQALATQLETDYADNADGLKKVLEGLGAYVSVVDKLVDGKLPAKFENKTWDELREANLLGELKEKYFDHYKEMWETEYDQEYKA